MKPDEKVTAYCISASFEDFDGDLQAWKDTFYELWRVQLTHEIAYEIKLIERRTNSDYGWVVNLDILVKEDFKDRTLDWMGKNGYRNIRTREETVGIVYGYNDEPGDDIEDVDFLTLHI